MKQDAPFTVLIELTEGCSFYCEFCGIRGIRKGPGDFKHMSMALAKKIAQQIKAAGWEPRVEFAMRGEPTMNKNYKKIVHIFRKALPNTSMMMTTNGTGLLLGDGPVQNIKDLFDAGLNVLALDNYIAYPTGKTITGKIKDKFDIRYYPEQGQAASPHQRRRANEHLVTIIKDISLGKVGTRHLNCHCGCASPLDYTMAGKRCARVFRELVVWRDGTVPICCNEWRGEYCCGNVRNQSLDNIWQGQRFQAARQKLFHGQRNFKPCLGCNSRSFRVGLLPDKFGKQTVKRPSRNHLSLITKVTAEKPKTKPVLREWETTTSRPGRIRGYFEEKDNG